MKSSTVVIGVVCALAAHVVAEPRVTVHPKVLHAGDPVLVTVTAAKEAPTGTANGTALQFFRSRNGYQAVAAVPLDGKEDTMTIAVDKAKAKVVVPVRAKNFPEADVVVEDELANPDAPQRVQIDADNKAIIEALLKAKGDPQFTLGFRRPGGRVTSAFGEWRTFNDGHKSQHLGLDLTAKEGSPVRAVNAGTVTLVRDAYLAGTVVVVAHGGGIGTAYYHLSKTSVTEGQTVARGTPIGAAGKTGRSTGAHLHISVRTPGGMVDPAGFFKLPIAPAAQRGIVTKR
ncbi:MAG: M23 family metallopeptidase [Deltaproteobacteria bacterium]|nr:M23 family metallopeptidase [Deltaproteobacteria bacterium]